jgi:hypothetical protein
MKKLHFPNGDIRTGYELRDLDKETQDRVIADQGQFLQETENDPDYHPTEEDIVESIEINNYLYDDDGEMLDILYHTRQPNGEVWKITFGKKHTEITLTTFQP